MDYEKLGFLAIEHGDYQEACNIFRRAFEGGKTARSFFGFGVSNYHLGDFPTARWAFYKSMELQPDNKPAEKYISEIEKLTTKKPPAVRKAVFRVAANYLEVYTHRWSRFFVKGVNIGLGLPGYFPGEYPIKKGTYLSWFRQSADLGFNSVRIYTLHPPAFYQALYEYNKSSDKQIYLFQGIWTELPEHDDYNAKRYDAYVKENIRSAVNAVYGNITLPERPGYAHGSYIYDVSPYCAAFIFGREWESCSVRGFNEMHGRKTGDYTGSFISLHGGTPFERWIAKMCDFMQDYEYGQYGLTRPVSVNSWPTLDPLIHESESNYEDELLVQGIRARKDICSENEDMESLDTAKIRIEKGAGFFPSYHVYPYYPDFMNHDYLDHDNTYLAYLRALKKHHEGQAVLIAEFGVPSSREVTHWHRDGWHHGGHNSASQAEVNGIQMKSITEAGMAGGIVFSLFDEWFKRNWMFFPYELPPERNPFWFNFQDAEQNYGLLAMYPGYPHKKVSLSGTLQEWSEASIIYKKENEKMFFRFNDGHDPSRDLQTLLMQHDEGFLYLFISTKGEVDFRHAHYLIGLDTCSPAAGEFLFPCATECKSPVGLKFLIHLAGRDKGRILVCSSYDKYLNADTRKIRPEKSDQGAWVIMKNKSNSRRISKNGKKYYPSHVYSMSNLRHGSLDSTNVDFDSLADFFVTGNRIEIRIPWGLINFTDPSSRTVLWMDRDGPTRKTDGIRPVALSYKPSERNVSARKTGLEHNITDSLPVHLRLEDVRTFSWKEWDVPVYHTYLKEPADAYKKVLADIPGSK